MTETTKPVEGRATSVAPRLSRPPGWLTMAFDAVVVTGLTVIAYAIRQGGLPVNGLWFDDSWVASGALHGRLTEIMTVGSGHPAFTALLMAWHRIGGGSIHSLAVPALVLGALGPAVLYLSLRSFGYRRSIALLLAAVLVVAATSVMYSGRVKPYTFDPVLVLAMGVALPWLARRTWRWPLAVAWVLVALLLGSFSGYVLVATAAAGIILFLHPAGDRVLRGCALAVQFAGQLVFYEWAQRSTDLAGIEQVLDDAYDAHLHVYLNPIRFGSEILTHLRRIVAVYPGGSGAWLTLLGLLAVAGLVAASIRSPRRSELLANRYLLLMFSMAFVGALAGKFPFGPTTSVLVTSGGRYTMWLTPAMAVGLAATAQRADDLVRRLAAGHQVARRALDVALVVAAGVVLLRGAHAAQPYPFPGSASATRYIDTHLRPGDVALITSQSVYAFADLTDRRVTVIPTPTRQVGFTPHVDDPQILNLGLWGDVGDDPASIRHETRDAKRVFVLGGGAFGPANVAAVGAVLQSAGWRSHVVSFGSDVVVVWQR